MGSRVSAPKWGGRYLWLLWLRCVWLWRLGCLLLFVVKMVVTCTSAEAVQTNPAHEPDQAKSGWGGGAALCSV